MYKCGFCGYTQTEPMAECPECIRPKIAEVEAEAKIKASEAKQKTQKTK